MHDPPTPPPSPQRRHARYLLRILTEMAHTDDDMDERERRVLYEVADAHDELCTADVDAAIAHVKDPATEAPTLAWETRVEVLRQLVTVMQSDRVVSRKELAMMRRCGGQMGVPPGRLDDFCDMALHAGQSGLTGATLVAAIETYVA